MLRCSCSTAASYLGIGTLKFSGSLGVNDALFPSKSGLINKHTVKHTVEHIVKHIGEWKDRVNASFLVPCARPSPDLYKHIVKHIVPLVRTNTQTCRETKMAKSNGYATATQSPSAKIRVC
jgi:hypothetical protein